MGNEFSSVEALWSTFENVMGKEEEGEGGEMTAGREDGGSNVNEAKSNDGQEELEQEEDVKAES